MSMPAAGGAGAPPPRPILRRTDEPEQVRSGSVESLLEDGKVIISREGVSILQDNNSADIGKVVGNKVYDIANNSEIGSLIVSNRNVKYVPLGG